MNQNLCSEFIHHLDRDGSLECGPAPESVQKWLEGFDLPVDLHRFLRWSWPQTDGYIAHIRVHSSATLRSHDATAPLLKHKLLHAGNAPNGDFFVIDFSTEACIPGFVTHEEWDPWSEEPEDPRSYLEPIARSFESFLYRAVEGRYLPRDYYAASAFNAFLAKERTGRSEVPPGSTG